MISTLMGEIILRIESRMENIGFLGVCIKSIYSKVFTPQEAGVIEMGAVEAVTNIVEHGYRYKPNNYIELKLIMYNNRMTIVINDNGSPIPSSILNGKPEDVFDFDPKDLDSLPENGMGIALIKKVFDEVEYHVGQRSNSLKLVKYARTIQSNDT